MKPGSAPKAKLLADISAYLRVFAGICGFGEIFGRHTWQGQESSKLTMSKHQGGTKNQAQKARLVRLWPPVAARGKGTR
jgi:hypothetical protein